MNIEEDLQVQCPFCFETILVRVDTSAGVQQELVYDCEVCCRPIELSIACVPGQQTQILASREWGSNWLLFVREVFE